MKHFFLLLFLFVLSPCLHSQNAKATKDTLQSLLIVDELPVFPGGENALPYFIAKKMKYQRDILEGGGTMLSFNMSFVITDSGKVKEVTITEPLKDYEDVQLELKRVLELMPLWKPGKKDGKTVNVFYKIGVSTYYSSSTKMNEVTIYDISLFANKKAKGDKAYESGVKKSEQGDFQAAVADYTEALKYNPSDIDALYNRGVLKFKLNDKPGACADWLLIRKEGVKDADELISKYCGK